MRSGWLSNKSQLKHRILGTEDGKVTAERAIGGVEVDGVPAGVLGGLEPGVADGLVGY